MRRIALTGGIATGQEPRPRASSRRWASRRSMPTRSRGRRSRLASPGLAAVVRDSGRDILDAVGALDRRKLAAYRLHRSRRAARSRSDRSPDRAARHRRVVRLARSRRSSVRHRRHPAALRNRPGPRLRRGHRRRLRSRRRSCAGSWTRRQAHRRGSAARASPRSCRSTRRCAAPTT